MSSFQRFRELVETPVVSAKPSLTSGNVIVVCFEGSARESFDTVRCLPATIDLRWSFVTMMRSTLAQ
ncbi:hypothetical protein D3C83_44450 [compost metagenome]